MKYIKLTQNKLAIVDDEDFEFLNKWKWFYHNGYAKRNNPEKRPGHIFMHRLINNTPEGMDTDHINRNKLDNRKENLRSTSRRENIINTNLRSTNKSGYKGIRWVDKLNKWRVRLWFNYKTINVGVYDDLSEAIEARKEAEKAML